MVTVIVMVVWEPENSELLQIHEFGSSLSQLLRYSYYYYNCNHNYNCNNGAKRQSQVLELPSAEPKEMLEYRQQSWQTFWR